MSTPSDRLRAAAAGGPVPSGARRLIRLDLPPQADLTAAPPWLVLNPATGEVVEAPIEVCGEGVRLWHDRARRLGLAPGMPAWVMPPPPAAT